MAIFWRKSRKKGVCQDNKSNLFVLGLALCFASRSGTWGVGYLQKLISLQVIKKKSLQVIDREKSLQQKILFSFQLDSGAMNPLVAFKV